MVGKQRCCIRTSQRSQTIQHIHKGTFTDRRLHCSLVRIVQKPVHRCLHFSRVVQLIDLFLLHTCNGTFMHADCNGNYCWSQRFPACQQAIIIQEKFNCCLNAKDCPRGESPRTKYIKPVERLCSHLPAHFTNV